MKKLPERQVALLQVFGAALFFGLSAPASKVLLNRIDPLVMASLLYVGAWGGLTLLSLFSRRPAEGTRIEKRHVPWFLASVGVGGILGQLVLMWGIAHTPASFASLLFNFEIVWTVLMAGLLFGEHLGKRVLGAMALMFLSGAVLSYQGIPGDFGFLGPLAVIGACFCWGVDNNLTGRISDIDPVLLTRVKGGLSGSVNLGLAFFLGRKLPLDATLLWALLLGAVTYGGSLILFIRALRVLGTARTGAYFGMSPFIGAVASILFLHEPLSANLLLAGAGMAAAAYLLFHEKHGHPHFHPELQHEHFHEHDAHHDHHPEGKEVAPHSHLHLHEPLEHEHPHWPDVHHRHAH